MEASFYTERLFLRRFRLEDAEPIFHSYASNPEVSRYLSWPTHQRVEDTQAWLSILDEQWESLAHLAYGVYSKEDESLLGSAGLSFKQPFSAEFGYCLKPEAWGKGYTTELMKALLHQFFQRPDAVRAAACCHIDNVASAKVMEKVGMQYEGTFRKSMIFPNLSPEPQDIHYYALIR